MTKWVTFSRDFGNYRAGQTAPVRDTTARVAIRDGAAVLADEPTDDAVPPSHGNSQGPKPTPAKGKSRRRKNKK